MRRAGRGGRAIALAILVLAGATPGLGAQTRPVTVVVVSAVGEQPLGYSIVSTMSPPMERLTGPDGRVTLRLPIGDVRLTVKRLGFEPSELTYMVTRSSPQVVRVTLHRFAAQFDTVRVTAWPACEGPGAPSAAVDGVARRVVEQLHQNADRYRVLEQQYPFVYRLERAFSRLADGVEVPEAADTTILASEVAWRYRPGTLVKEERRYLLSRQVDRTMRIPTLRDLRERAFVDTHCWHVAGIEDKGGQRLLRVDIVAADSISTPDVNIAAWVDTADFRLRAASISLSRMPSEMPTLVRFTTEIFFVELIPFVPVMFATTATSVHRDDEATERTFIERQQMLDVRFTLAPPPGYVQEPARARGRRRP
jgi:hypothetical protein